MNAESNHQLMEPDREAYEEFEGRRAAYWKADDYETKFVTGKALLECKHIQDQTVISSGLRENFWNMLTCTEDNEEDIKKLDDFVSGICSTALRTPDHLKSPAQLIAETDKFNAETRSLPA